MQPLVIDGRIPLGTVKGRIDHLAIDLGGDRLAVAELSQGAVGIVDLKLNKALPPIEGLHEPQGLAFQELGGDLFVASGDGSLRRFSGDALRPLAQIQVGDDADNVRPIPGSDHILVGYGSGALALLDGRSPRSSFEVALGSHPESFQIAPDQDHIYVNVPGKHRIDVASLASRRVVASIGTGTSFANFPMAIDTGRQRLVVVFRMPAEVRTYSLADNHLIGRVPTCGDSDDVFVDARRDRLYVVCGEGVVDVLGGADGGYTEVTRVKTAGGARTGLWSPQKDRLYVAAPARGRSGAGILIFRPGG
jgi:hypothetical protein